MSDSNEAKKTEQKIPPLHPEDTKAQVERAKKNLIYVAMFSVVMLFAGFISAYVVSMGDSFWLKFPLPTAFWISTVTILVSSIFIQLSVHFAKKGKASAQRATIIITLALGLGFVYYQFKGYGQLIDNGIHAVSSNIIVVDGRLGDYYDIKMNGDFIDVNGNDYTIKGKKMSDGQMEDLRKFMSQFYTYNPEKAFKVKDTKKFTLYLKNSPLKAVDGVLQTKDGEKLTLLDEERLYFLAINIRDGRGDFFARGVMGKDFHVYFKGKEVTYKNRKLYWKDQELTPYMQTKIMQSPDTASAFLYIITFVHLAHVIITVLFLFRAVIHSFTGRISTEHTIGLRMTTIFWHFLGALWLILLLFLLFIH